MSDLQYPVHETVWVVSEYFLGQIYKGVLLAAYESTEENGVFYARLKNKNGGVMSYEVRPEGSIFTSEAGAVAEVEKRKEAMIQQLETKIANLRDLKVDIRG